MYIGQIAYLRGTTYAYCSHTRLRYHMSLDLPDTCVRAAQAAPLVS